MVDSTKMEAKGGGGGGHVGVRESNDITVVQSPA